MTPWSQPNILQTWNSHETAHRPDPQMVLQALVLTLTVPHQIPRVSFGSTRPAPHSAPCWTSQSKARALASSPLITGVGGGGGGGSGGGGGGSGGGGGVTSTTT